MRFAKQLKRLLSIVSLTHTFHKQSKIGESDEGKEFQRDNVSLHKECKQNSLSAGQLKIVWKVSAHPTTTRRPFPKPAHRQEPTIWLCPFHSQEILLREAWKVSLYLRKGVNSSDRIQFQMVWPFSRKAPDNLDPRTLERCVTEAMRLWLSMPDAPLTGYIKLRVQKEIITSLHLNIYSFLIRYLRHWISGSVFSGIYGLFPSRAITSECGDINMSKCRKRDEIKHILLKEMRAP